MEDSQELIAAREEVTAMMARARAAQEQIANYTQEQVDDLIRAMVWAVAREDRALLEELSRQEAVHECADEKDRKLRVEG